MEKLKIAIQARGRLNEESMKLIEDSGIGLTIGRRKLVSEAVNFPLEALFLRDDDIPQTVADGVADVGIVGENEMLERGKNVVIAKRLGFSRCRLSLAIPKSAEYPGPEFSTEKRLQPPIPPFFRNFLKNTILTLKFT